MLLSALQHQYESLYQLPPCRAIEDFLINQETLTTLTAGALLLPPVGHHRGMLLLSPQGDELGVAVYLNDQVMHNLAIHDPRTGLHATNIGDFCILVEEVSHFLYTTWKARQDWQMTRLEMELQAEVDKFIFCSFYCTHTDNYGSGLSLKELLFEHFNLEDHLPREAKKRYLTASKLALHYCHFLEKRYLKRDLTEHMLREIRQFYRFGQTDKISHINRSALLH